MSEQVFFAQDAEGALRRWNPTPEMMRGNEMARAIRGGSPGNHVASLIEFLAARLVNVYGENERMDFILAARERAAMFRKALPDNRPTAEVNMAEASEIEKEERAHSQTIRERDEVEKAFADAYELVMGEPIEWSSAYTTLEALHDMEIRLRRERTQRQST